MRFDFSNFVGLANAVKGYEDSDKSEPLVLVIQTPGRLLYRFIVTETGIEKQDCDMTGGPRW